jgi:hypothetical protein
MSGNSGAAVTGSAVTEKNAAANARPLISGSDRYMRRIASAKKGRVESAALRKP